MKKNNNKTKILMVVSEMFPFAKTGGLADVAGSLPYEFLELGYDVRVVIPYYRDVINQKLNYEKSIDLIIPTAEGEKSATLIIYLHKGIYIYFISYNPYFDNDELYEKSGYNDHHYNIVRFSLFCRGVLEMCKKIDFKPNIFHCHDWHTALVPTYLKTIYKTDPFFKECKILFTIHNLAYQGLSSVKHWQHLVLSNDLFSMNYLEYWGQINLLKGALIFSDILTTVSKRYAEEIQTPEFGCGLEGILKERKDDLYGILNGIDYKIWNPDNDPFTYGIHYSYNDLSGKEKIKQKLVEEFDLSYQPNIPLIGMVSRLVTQKGFDLLIEIADQFLEEKILFILLGKGEARLHTFFEELHKKYPQKVGVKLIFDNETAHKIEAGSDLFLMPSQFEPSGLNQLYSLRYGTIPIVRATGGLADSIRDDQNGFSFEQYKASHLLNTIKRAIKTFHNKKKWNHMIETAMSENWSWKKSSQQYHELFRKML